MQQIEDLKTDGAASKVRTDAENQRVAFAPEQQAKVQELIDEAYRKAYAKALKSRSSSEEVERLRSEVDALKQERKTSALYKAISRYNVVDAEEVAKLVGERVSMDEKGAVMVALGSGEAVVNGAGHQMGLDEYIAQWLSERPHHLRASGTSGAGSGSARFGTGAWRLNLKDPSVWRSMPREELDRYLQEGVSIHGSAGQVYKFRDVRNPFLDARKRRFNSTQSSRQSI